MLTLLRQRNFGLLWWGGLISFIGDWVLFVSLPLYILDLTRSVVAMGTLFIVNILPGLFLGSVAGVFVDRWDRRRILVVDQPHAGAALLALPLLQHARHGVDRLPGRLQRQPDTPAPQSRRDGPPPRLVGEADLVIANSLNALNNNLCSPDRPRYRRRGLRHPRLPRLRAH